MWAESALLNPQRQQALLEESLDALDAQLAIIASNGTIVYLSRRWRDLQGAHRSLITAELGSSIRDGLASHEALIPGLRDALTAVWQGNSSQYSRRIELEDRGRTRWVSLEVHRLAIGAVMIVLRDITAVMTRELHLQRQATRDSLTDLPNRTLLADELQTSLEGVSRGEGNLGVLLCDLDSFKSVNDSHGHSAGDEVLVNVAHRWLAALRPPDVLGRLGGDEFLVIAPGLHDTSELKAIAQRLETSLQSPIRCSRVTVSASACIGAVFIRSGSAHCSTQSLLKRADRALYAAKHAGPASVRLILLNGHISAIQAADR